MKSSIALSRRRSGLSSLGLAAFMALLATLPLACSKSDDKGGGGGGETPGRTTCESRADCDGGQACTDGYCGSCGSDRDCEFNERCNAASLRCEFRKGWGNDCTAHTDCALGMSCSQGLCMPAELTVECGARGQCPEGMRCNRQLLMCEEDLGCRSSLDCAEGEVCNVGIGQCFPGCTEENEAEVCAGRQHCSNSLCVECEEDSECNPGFSCNVEAGRCVGAKSCFTDRDCEAGLICNRSTKSCTEPPPPCFHDNNCLSDEFCDLRKQLCMLRECTGDQDSPNNTQELATPIQSGLRVDLQVCQLESKWYKIALLRGDRLNVKVETDVLSADGLDSEILDEVGNVLAKDPLYLDATVGLAGTYYLRVRTTDAQVRYSLNVLVARGEPCDDDRFRGNDNVVRAAPLEAGTELGLIACPATSDFFVVEVPTGKGVRVTLQHDPLQGLLGLVLRDGDGQRQLSADLGTGGEKKVESSAVSQGRAYIVVYPQDGRVKNTYDLSVTTY